MKSGQRGVTYHWSCFFFLDLLMDRPSPPAGDVVILDQHLDYPHGTVFGTDIAQQLRRRGYAGLPKSSPP